MTDSHSRSEYRVSGGLMFQPARFNTVINALLPDEVCIAVDQALQLTVAPGDQVLSGQLLCEVHPDIPACHASISGIVKDTRNHHVSIASDGQDKAFEHAVPDTSDIAAFEQHCRKMGLVGLGGATFPVDGKLRAARNNYKEGIDTLLINAAECDPDIYCDEALIQEEPEIIATGIQLLWQHSNARQCIVGIEENKKSAIDLLEQHLPSGVQLVCVPAIYPSGAENTLFALCTGKSSGLKNHRSVCFNIATCYSIAKAIKFAQPLISRVTTISSGSELLNLQLRIGTPIAALIKHLKISDSREIIHGGRMMGIPVAHNSYVHKGTNSLIFRKPDALNTRPCIRCGKCADVCPEKLMPQHLYWNSRSYNSTALEDLDLQRCIECACCDQVCPSHIKLASQFSQAKKNMRQESIDREKAAQARKRYEKRLTRLDKQSSKQRQQLNKKSTILSNSKKSSEVKKDLIAKALQRNKHKKPSSGSTGHE